MSLSARTWCCRTRCSLRASASSLSMRSTALGSTKGKDARPLPVGRHGLPLSPPPSPRTLHLSLAGLRDASILSTPPPGRKPVITTIAPLGAGHVRTALSAELGRGGQVFYVVPRISGIEATVAWVEELIPGLRVLAAHGEMRDLEARIWSFALGEADVLVCTTIIENGINMPRVNTIIVQDASYFGLAQLHQLRGRVGRSSLQAYAWMFHSAASAAAVVNSAGGGVRRSGQARRSGGARQ
eukprot:TRINITY_DN8498_c0_g1_i1.p2 TRINITY_DN8498_c0_g1~~TRINITY_DN8498_c0_g1_i1.p2  ORF type:complete len:241 (+),score=72.44 TRINITY_DN8498_c0_g1_i1:684-1406(+)